MIVLPRFSRFRRLSRLERKLLVDALGRLIVARLGLWFLPFEKVRLLLPKRRLSSPSASSTSIVWSIQGAKRLVPGANCLVQAVATQSLLTKHGIESRLVFGVALEEPQKFKAHAWVECDGRIIIGESSTTTYKQLFSLDSVK